MATPVLEVKIWELVSFKMLIPIGGFTREEGVKSGLPPPTSKTRKCLYLSAATVSFFHFQRNKFDQKNQRKTKKNQNTWKLLKSARKSFFLCLHQELFSTPPLFPRAEILVPKVVVAGRIFNLHYYYSGSIIQLGQLDGILINFLVDYQHARLHSPAYFSSISHAQLASFKGLRFKLTCISIAITAW